VKPLVLVLLMAGVTFVSRVLPLFLFKRLFRNGEETRRTGAQLEGGTAAGVCPDDCRPAFTPGAPGLSWNPMRDVARRLLARSLSLIPYAALGALIFPGVFAGKTSFSYAAAAGASAAFVTSLLGGGLVPSVAASVAVSYGVLVLKGP
jgi:branched-subunit amino acid transport protein